MRQHNYPAVHNAMWPGLVGKGPDSEPPIDLDTMIEMTAAYTTQHTTAEILQHAELLRIPSGPVGNGATVTGFDHFVERKVFVENPNARFVQPRIPYAIPGVEPSAFSPAPLPFAPHTPLTHLLPTPHAPALQRQFLVANLPFVILPIRVT